MAAPSGEGLFLDGESVEAMMTNAELVIKTYCEEVMKNIAQYDNKQTMEPEESKAEQEEEEDQEEDQDEDESGGHTDDKEDKPDHDYSGLLDSNSSNSKKDEQSDDDER